MAVQLRGGQLAGTGDGLSGGGGNSSAERVIRTQADLARVPDVVDRTIKASGLDRSPGELLANSSVSFGENSDLLTFKVGDRDPRVAAQLATEYARQYTPDITGWLTKFRPAALSSDARSEISLFNSNR